MTNPTAAMLLIGDEILSGRTRDANMYYLAGVLTKIGIDLKEVRVVSDDKAAIIAAVTALSEAHDTVITSGGIGPTHDDITADAVAQAFDVPLLTRQDAVEALARNYKNGKDDLTPARLAKLIGGLLHDRTSLMSMAASAKRLARRGAAARILQECRTVLLEKV